jgi:catechol 2,3-dioxygenase-like lactoylglutathione lyase family enzyme
MKFNYQRGKKMSGIPIDAQITFLYVADLRRSADFYENILGLSLANDQGSCRIYRVTGGDAYLGICERESTVAAGDTLIFTIVTADVDRWHRQLQSRGWPCDNPPSVNQQYNIYHFFTRDPDGYKLEIQRFLDENWNAES